MEGVFDAHCHIDTSPAAPPPPPPPGPAVIGRLLCGVDPSDWERIALAATTWPGTRTAFGLHPWHVGSAAPDWLARLERRLAADPGAWLGEAGLDSLKTVESPETDQTRAFQEQLRLARRLGRPVNLHCVKAWPELIRLLDAAYLFGGPRGFIVHSFAGPHQYIRELAERGAYFSVGPLFSRRDTPRHRQRTALLPEDRLLLESDAFLVPGIDATEDLRHALAWLADVRKTDLEQMAARIAANARRLFDNG